MLNLLKLLLSDIVIGLLGIFINGLPFFDDTFTSSTIQESFAERLIRVISYSFNTFFPSCRRRAKEELAGAKRKETRTIPSRSYSFAVATPVTAMSIAFLSVDPPNGRRSDRHNRFAAWLSRDACLA